MRTLSPPRNRRARASRRAHPCPLTPRYGDRLARESLEPPMSEAFAFILYAARTPHRPHMRAQTLAGHTSRASPITPTAPTPLLLLGLRLRDAARRRLGGPQAAVARRRSCAPALWESSSENSLLGPHASGRLLVRLTWRALLPLPPAEASAYATSARPLHSRSEGACPNNCWPVRCCGGLPLAPGPRPCRADGGLDLRYARGADGLAIAAADVFGAS